MNTVFIRSQQLNTYKMFSTTFNQVFEQTITMTGKFVYNGIVVIYATEHDV